MADELKDFIELHTTAMEFYEEEYPDIEWNIFSRYICANGIPYWWLQQILKRYNRQDGKTLKEEDILCIEERLIHPIIAIQAMYIEIDRIIGDGFELLRQLSEMELKLDPLWEIVW